MKTVQMHRVTTTHNAKTDERVISYVELGVDYHAGWGLPEHAQQIVDEQIVDVTVFEVGDRCTADLVRGEEELIDDEDGFLVDGGELITKAGTVTSVHVTRGIIEFDDGDVQVMSLVQGDRGYPGSNIQPEPEDDEKSMYYRLDDDGNAEILQDGEIVTWITKGQVVYPVNSDLSVRCDHPHGIVLTVEDAHLLGIFEEDASIEPERVCSHTNKSRRMMITVTQLKKLQPCKDEFKRFKQRFGNGLELTKKNCLLLAEHLFDVGWLARNLLEGNALDKYRELVEKMVLDRSLPAPWYGYVEIEALALWKVIKMDNN